MVGGVAGFDHGVSPNGDIGPGRVQAIYGGGGGKAFVARLAGGGSGYAGDLERQPGGGEHKRRGALHGSGVDCCAADGDGDGDQRSG